MRISVPFAKKMSKNLMPSIASKGNFLHVMDTPVELAELTPIEKTLISQIQVFMTIVILPGGQYVEKGLVLNVPAPCENIIS